MRSKLVTIIIPSFNHARYIESAIKSVLDQTYQDIELIIIDDGSSDGTHALLEKYRGASNIMVILNTKNRGQAFVLNEAVNLARGDYIGLLPSDDWYLPRKIELQVKKFEVVGDSVGVIYGNGFLFLENKKKLVPTSAKLHRGPVLEKMLTEPFFVLPVTPLFRKNCFSFVQFDEKYTAEGEGLYIRLAQYVNYDYVEEPLAVMRTHTYNTGNNIALMCEENLRWWPDLFSGKDFPPELKKYETRVLARLRRLYGLDYVTQTKTPKRGRHLLLSAMTGNPSYLFDPKMYIGLLLTFLPESFCSKVMQLRRN